METLAEMFEKYMGKKEEKKEEKRFPMEAIKVDGLSAIKINGTVVGVPEDMDCVYIDIVPGMFGLGKELVIKPCLPLPSEQIAEIEKKERETVEKPVEVPVPKIVKIPEVIEKKVEVPVEKIVEKKVEVEKLKKEEELTPEELKKEKPEEFEEEEIPPEKRREFGKTLAEIVKEKAIPKIKEGIKKLAEIGKTKIKRLGAWLKKVVSNPEIHEALEELEREEEEKELEIEKEIEARKMETLKEVV